MDINLQRRRAEDLRTRHHGEQPLVLPNAWDVGSAVLIASMGFPVVASSSAGVAWALGLPDGERLGRVQMLDVVGRIAMRVDLPVSADLERGYGDIPEEVAETMRMAIAAGVVGVNLEDGLGNADDGLRDLELAMECVAEARSVGAAIGVPLVINARTDVYFDRGAPPEWKLEEAVRRSNHYLEAGADCAFVIGVGEASAIATLVREIDGPVNIIAGSGGLDVKGLSDLGVKRISLGGGMAGTAFGALRNALGELGRNGSLGFLEHGMTHGELQELFGG